MVSERRGELPGAAGAGTVGPSQSIGTAVVGRGRGL